MSSGFFSSTILLDCKSLFLSVEIRLPVSLNNNIGVAKKIIDDFNHAQLVSVAGIECQTCHGPVEEMEILYQHSPLTMGWCINCHRETNVKVKDNEYYAKIHEELSKKYGVETLTVAQMGGLECGKCHY